MPSDSTEAEQTVSGALSSHITQYAAMRFDFGKYLPAMKNCRQRRLQLSLTSIPIEFAPKKPGSRTSPKPGWWTRTGVSQCGGSRLIQCSRQWEEGRRSQTHV